MESNHRALLGALILALGLYGCGGSSGTSAGASSPITEAPGAGGTLPGDVGFVDATNPLGFYSNGSIANSTTLPDSGSGFLKVFRLRNRNYATGTMVRAIEIAASAWRAEFPVGDRVQVGDITDLNGGFLSGHASHQNGLDADIAYLKANHIERDPNTNGSTGFGESFVVNGAVTANFDLVRNWAILRNFVGRGNVGRIFVDPVIKAAFCTKAAVLDPSLDATARTEVLRRLRPYAAHDDHFHIRLLCPAGHSQCLAQTDPPTGNGCADVGVATGDSVGEPATAAQIADDDLGDDEG